MPKPFVQVLALRADWEDITSDIRALSVEQFRDLRAEYMNGRVLDMELNNAHGRYSPAGPQRPDAGLRPGQALWARCWYPYDAFDGAASTPLRDHSPDNDRSWTWSNDGHVIELDGSGAARTSAGAAGRLLAAMAFHDTDVTLASQVTMGTNSVRFGLCLRFADADNHAYVAVSRTEVGLRKRVGGADSQVSGASPLARPWASGETRLLHVELHGSRVRVMVDREAVLEATLDDPAINGATKHGLFAEDHNDHTWRDFGGYRSLFYGAVSKVRPRPGSGRQYCYVQAHDDFERAKRVELRSYNIAAAATSNYHHRILDYGGAGQDRRLGTLRRLNDGEFQDYQPVTDRLLTAVYRLQDEEDGLFYVDGNGYYRFEERDHRTRAPHTVSKAVYCDTYNGSDAAFTDEEWEEGTDHVESVVVVQYRRGMPSPGEVTLWQSGRAFDGSRAIRFLAGQTLTVVANIAEGEYDAAFHAVSPLSTGDFQANSEPDGTGVDLTRDITAVVTDSGRYWASAVKIEITAADPLSYGTEGYVTQLRLRGRAVKLLSPSEVEASDSASMDTFGERRRVIRCNFITNHEEAALLASSRLERRRQPRTAMVLTLAAGDRSTLHHMVQRSISDRVTVRESALGIDRDFFIEGESWRFSSGLRTVQRLQLSAA